MLAEGNAFQNLAVVAEAPIDGQLFTSPDSSTNAACTAYLGRACVVNAFGSSGAFKQSDTAFLVDFKGKNVASAASASGVESAVAANAGVGKI